MKSAIKKDKVEQSKVRVLSKVVRLDLVEKIRLEQKFEGDEGVHYERGYLREQCSKQREQPVQGP